MKDLSKMTLIALLAIVIASNVKAVKNVTGAGA